MPAAQLGCARRRPPSNSRRRRLLPTLFQCSRRRLYSTAAMLLLPTTMNQPLRCQRRPNCSLAGGNAVPRTLVMRSTKCRIESSAEG
uniref:Uncharacterized protein n=1 Tax=Setaria italica TaxID=4555 RepID=K4AHC2_SETIT